MPKMGLTRSGSVPDLRQDPAENQTHNNPLHLKTAETRMHQLRRTNSNLGQAEGLAPPKPIKPEDLPKDVREKNEKEAKLRQHFEDRFVVGHEGYLGNRHHYALDDVPLRGAKQMVSMGTQVDEHLIKQTMKDAVSVAPILGEMHRDHDIMHPTILQKINVAAEQLAKMVVKEVGTDTLKAKNNLADQKFTLSEGNLLGIRLGEQIFTLEDARIFDDDTRYACTKALEHLTGRNVVWVETEGMVQFDGAVMGTLGGVIPYTVLSGGITGGAMLRYRVLQPYPLGFFKTPQDLIRNNTFRLPVTATNARNMRAGSEVEFAMQGKLALDGTIGLVYGLGAGPGTLGVGVSGIVEASVAREYGVTVVALDGRQKVRVKVKDIDREKAGLIGRLQAGFLLQPGSLSSLIDSVPLATSGQLKIIAEKFGHHSIESLVTAYTSLTLEGGIHGERVNTDLFSFDFDLSIPQAAEAYGQLMRMDGRLAQRLANQPGSGVTLIKAEEKTTSLSAEASAGLVGQKLFLAQALSTQKHSDVMRKDGTHTVSHASTYAENFKTIFTPAKRVEWEIVTVTSEKKNTATGQITTETHPSFRFHFTKENRVSYQEEIDALFRFAKVLGIETAEESSSKLVDLPFLKRLFLGDDDTSVDVDIYFTESGIKRIERAERPKITTAYYDVAKGLLPELNGEYPLHPNDNSTKGKAAKELMKQYEDELSQVSRFNLIKRYMIRREYRERYHTHVGRNFDLDRKIYKEAHEFADRLEKLTDVTSPVQLEHFFTALGRSRGCDYMQSIATLARLAEKDDTLIHSLSIKGGGVLLRSKDEGLITPPREEILKIMNQVAA